MAHLNPSTEDARLHLAILGKRELYNLVAKNHKTSAVVNTWLKEDDVVAWAQEKNSEGYTCWVSLNDKEDGNDSIEGVKSLNVFWLDIDSKREDKAKPATEQQLNESLQRAQNLKTLIEKEFDARGFLAYSGNGCHVFFPLPRFELVGSAFRREVNLKVRLFAKQVSAKVNAEIDSTYDIRRVTTLIGSYNLKLQSHPLKTRWISESAQSLPEAERARTANRHLLEAILNTETKSQATAQTQLQSQHSTLDELLLEDAKLLELFRGDWQKYGYKSRSEAEQAVVTKLVLKGLSDDEINAAMQRCSIGKWQEKSGSYRALSIAHAREHATTPTGPHQTDSLRQDSKAANKYKDKGKEKEKEKPKLHKSCGISEQGYYESIYYRGKPAFLVVDKGIFRVFEEVTAENETFLPKEYPNEMPYEPYGFFEAALPNSEDLFWKVREEFDLFLDVESIWKDYLAACVLLSYQQEKLLTVPYPYFVGDNESGKTVALSLLNWLCYRPMLGVTIPPADIYGYLDDSDAPGTILEDEAQGLQRDMDKAKIYKAGYKQGAVVPRTMITQHKRFIKYFRVFCFKACAAEEMPRVKGLLERFIFIPMVEGYPRKDWADFNEEDKKRLRQLRDMLLKWRMSTYEWKIPEIELPIKGRLKELWKPIIQVVSGLTVEKDLREQLEQLAKERLSEKVNTLEGHIVKVVCELYTPNEPVTFSDVWDALVKDLGGKLDEKKPNKMDTPEFGEVTKQKVGYRLREVLNGKKSKARLQDGPEYVYDFAVEKLKRIAKKYCCELVLKFSSKPTLGENAPSKAVDEVEEKSVISENTPNSKTQETETETDTPLEVSKLENSRTSFTIEELASKAKSVYRLTMDFGIETCICCGAKGRPEWQVTEFDDSWGFLCGICGQKLSERLSKNE